MVKNSKITAVYKLEKCMHVHGALTLIMLLLETVPPHIEFLCWRASLINGLIKLSISLMNH